LPTEPVDDAYVGLWPIAAVSRRAVIGSLLE
jgi:hypothetical protein